MMLRRRPHKRFKNACDGTGGMPVNLWLDNNPDGTVRLTPCCPVCRTPAPIRKHANPAKRWYKGSLRMHRGVRRPWWRRLLGRGGCVPHYPGSQEP